MKVLVKRGVSYCPSKWTPLVIHLADQGRHVEAKVYYKKLRGLYSVLKVESGGKKYWILSDDGEPVMLDPAEIENVFEERANESEKQP